MTPTHAVVDTIDGATWVKDADGELFTEATAEAFARQQNELRPAFATCIVMNLTKRHTHLDWGPPFTPEGN
jgi:Rps23 Pro-64 3,4-dihydroxylase Tpa1-like proline 4-hydroxylase